MTAKKPKIIFDNERWLQTTRSSSPEVGHWRFHSLLGRRSPHSALPRWRPPLSRRPKGDLFDSNEWSVRAAWWPWRILPAQLRNWMRWDMRQWDNETCWLLLTFYFRGRCVCPSLANNPAFQKGATQIHDQGQQNEQPLRRRLPKPITTWTHHRWQNQVQNHFGSSCTFHQGVPKRILGLGFKFTHATELISLVSWCIFDALVGYHSNYSFMMGCSRNVSIEKFH